MLGVRAIAWVIVVRDLLRPREGLVVVLWMACAANTTSARDRRELSTRDQRTGVIKLGMPEHSVVMMLEVLREGHYERKLFTKIVHKVPDFGDLWPVARHEAISRRRTYRLLAVGLQAAGDTRVSEAVTAFRVCLKLPLRHARLSRA